MKYAVNKIASLYQQMGGSFFLYNLDAMEDHLGSLGADGVRLWYACKANPLSAILNSVNRSNFSFDVASLGELDQVIRAGVDPRKILLTGPVKQAKFLERALTYGVEWYVVESHYQLKKIELFAEQFQKPVNVLVRLQLNWQQEEKSVLGGNKISAFGMAPEDWESISSSEFVQIRGVHVFQWGNILDEKRLTDIWSHIAKAANEFAEKKGFALDVLDLGGGLGISYEDPTKKVSWSELRVSLADVRKISGAKEVWLELGRYAVGPFGTYVTKVEEVKTVRNQRLAICNGGSHHLVRPALVQESFPVELVRNSSRSMVSFQVHGPLCTALDQLGTYDLPEDLASGDLLAFSQTGAYGFTESMPFFLCHELAGEVVLKNGEFQVMRPVDSPTVWLR